MPKRHRHGRFNDAPSTKAIAGGISAGSRLVVGNPNGNREQRRAAVKLAKKAKVSK